MKVVIAMMKMAFNARAALQLSGLGVNFLVY